MPSKQSRNVKVQSRPVSSSVSDEQTVNDRLSLIFRDTPIQFENAKLKIMSSQISSRAIYELVTEFEVTEFDIFFDTETNRSPAYLYAYIDW